jgi:hypothetical protein
MKEPAIKGTLFSAVVADLNALVERGRISPEMLESNLEPQDLAHLDEKINAASWYDIHAYHRMVELLCKVESGGRESYWFERGVRAARRLRKTGIYHQMDYLGRTMVSGEIDPTARFNAFAKDMRLLLTIHASMLNFGDWTAIASRSGGSRAFPTASFRRRPACSAGCPRSPARRATVTGSSIGSTRTSSSFG